MIRRNPTLIPMSDYDVQDIRDMLAKQKGDALQQQQLLLRMKRIAENPTMQKEDLEIMEQFKAAAARYEKAKRLGLEPQTGAFRNV
jgi:hypothetical protein